MRISINFYLLHKSQSYANVYCFLRSEYKTATINTGLTVQAKYWDNRLHRVKKSCPESTDKNAFLNAFRVFVEHIITECRTRDVTVQFAEVVGVVKARVFHHARSSFVMYDEFVDYHKHKGILISRIRHFAIVRRHLTEFSSSENVELSLDTISNTTLDNFTSYLIGKNYTTSYIKLLLVLTRQFLNWAYDNDVMTNDKWKRFTTLATVSIKKNGCVFRSQHQIKEIRNEKIICEIIALHNICQPSL